MLDLLIFTSFKKAFSINNESLENPIVGGINTYTYMRNTYNVYVQLYCTCIIHVN